MNRVLIAASCTGICESSGSDYCEDLSLSLGEDNYGYGIRENSGF